MPLWNCPYCKLVINGKGKATHARFCEPAKKLIAKITKELLEELYLVEGMSIREIVEYTGLHSPKPLHRLFKEFGIIKRNSKERANQPRKLEQAKKTSLERYGHEWHLTKGSPCRSKLEETLKEEGITNVFQRAEIKEQSKETCIEKYGVPYYVVTQEAIERRKQWCLEEYGVENPFQAEPIKNKSKTTCMEKYGVEHYAQTQESKDRHIITSLKNHGVIYPFLKNNTNRNTFISRKVENELKILEVNYLKEQPIGKYYVDFLLPDHKLVIETYGDFWHANPKKYSADCVLNFPNGKITAKEKWDYDKKREQFIIDSGYSIIVLWEHDINHDVLYIERALESIATK